MIKLLKAKSKALESEITIKSRHRALLKPLTNRAGADPAACYPDYMIHTDPSSVTN